MGGITQQNHLKHLCSHTKKEFNPSWTVFLPYEAKVHSVKVLNRADCCGERLNGFNVKVGDAYCAKGIPSQSGRVHGVACRGRVGRTVRIEVPSFTYLTLCEVQVLAKPNLRSAFEVDEALNETALFEENGVQETFDALNFTDVNETSEGEDGM